MNISHDALGAAIQEVHRHGLKITGHLCSVGFTEAAELGIDDLEHGLLVDTEFTPGKQRDVCPNGMAASTSVENLDLKSAPAQRMIRTLVEHHVAVTSTLVVFEAQRARMRAVRQQRNSLTLWAGRFLPRPFCATSSMAMIPGRPPLEPSMLDAMSPFAAESYLGAKERAAGNPQARTSSRLKKEMDFEREFAAAGGPLIAGCDPTGNGGALPGFGHQRNLELLVEAGFKPEEAIRIYTSNAALFLGRSEQIGAAAAGKDADLVVVEGDPATHIADVRNMKYVFKNGTAFDPAKLIDSVRGSVGIH